MTDAYYKIRQLTLSDVPVVASLAARVFNQGPPAVSIPFLPLREQKPEDWESKLVHAMTSKLEARREARIERLRSEARRMRRELRLLRQGEEGDSGVGEVSPPQRVGRRASIEDSLPVPEASVEVKNRRKRRCFCCLVAEDQGTGEIVALSMLSLAQPEAILPPPFPTSKPLRAYLSNLAVDPRHRRKGIARRLVTASERVAKLWGFEEIYLHVEDGNIAAERLYISGAWQPIGSGGLQERSRDAIREPGRNLNGSTSNGIDRDGCGKNVGSLKGERATLDSFEKPYASENGSSAGESGRISVAQLLGQRISVPNIFQNIRFGPHPGKVLMKKRLTGCTGRIGDKDRFNSTPTVPLASGKSNKDGVFIWEIEQEEV